MIIRRFTARALLAPTLIFLTLGCGIASTQPASHTDAALPPSLLKRSIARATPETLAAFRTSLATQQARLSRTVARSGPKQLLRSSMTRALVDSGGIPRPQIESTMEELVAPTAKECGGASCSRIFGLTPDQVSTFLDESRDIIAKTPVHSAKDKIALRDFLLACLAKENSAVTSGKTVEERLAALPTVTLSSTPRPKASFQPADITKVLTPVEIGQITAYSNIFSKGFRTIEVSPMEKLMRAGYTSDAIADSRRRIAIINQALTKLPSVPGTVYRGLGNVKNEAISELFAFMDKKNLVALGQNNMPALTSTSWNLYVAQSFAVTFAKDAHAVIFTIKQRTGKSIDQISTYPGEEEVLIPSDAVFQVSNIAYINREKRLLSVELIEMIKNSM